WNGGGIADGSRSVEVGADTEERTDLTVERGAPVWLDLELPELRSFRLVMTETNLDRGTERTQRFYVERGATRLPTTPHFVPGRHRLRLETDDGRSGETTVEIPSDYSGVSATLKIH
ncbi:MAG TPA: hypothetical protein VKE69_09630, partial [Planctomycetota bacterium]|nr:hypothetical protein [Planctomycetota bacterium]